jgi:hypothetical protein
VSGFAAVDGDYVEASAGLGASPWRTFWSVVLPLTRGSLLTSAVLTFTHTVGEFGVVLMLGGNIPGATQTLSIALYDRVQEFNYAAANRTALVLVAVSPAALLPIYLAAAAAEARWTLSENATHLRAKIRHRLGAMVLDVAFELTQPWTVLFGPSGSGKTTVLRATRRIFQCGRMRQDRCRAESDDPGRYRCSVLFLRTNVRCELRDRLRGCFSYDDSAERQLWRRWGFRGEEATAG